MSPGNLAQHFTPLEAADLAYDLIEDLYGPLRTPRIIDPACGEGVLLWRAVERGLTPACRVFGVERDPNCVSRWPGARNGPRVVVGDAFTALSAPNGPGTFDLVVANPPYGTGAAGLREMSAEMASRLAAAYRLWLLPRSSRDKVAAKRLRTYPAELLFMELCLALARHGGHVAMFLPEGVVTNARYTAARRWLLEHVQIDAIIRLPNNTFRRSGVAAKTVLVLMTRQRPNSSHQVLFGETSLGGGEAETFCHSQRDCRLIQRLDPGYWKPTYEDLLASCRVPLVPLGHFITLLTYGPIVTRRAAKAWEDNSCAQQGGRKVAIVDQGQVSSCGVDLTDARRVPRNSPWVAERSLLRPGDVVLPRSGEGSLGKYRVAVFIDDEPASVGSFVDLIRLRDLNPFYLAAFVKSRLGRSQLSRIANGVGVPNISFGEIRQLLIPSLPSAKQVAIEETYRRKVLPLHRAAVRRHRILRKAGCDPKHDIELRELRAAAEERWNRAIAELDAATLGV